MNTAFELSEALIDQKSPELPLRYRLLKVLRYEYWPVLVVFFPALVYYLIQALRYRSLTFFTAANPSIECGGLFGESKHSILQQLPSLVRPATFLVEPRMSFESIKETMRKMGMTYPLIAKPDKGERGWGVEKIEGEEALITYYQKSDFPFLIQEYIEWTLEIAVLYYRYPDRIQSGISSLASKEFLTVRGDGKNRVVDLMMQDARSAFQVERFLREKPELLYSIPSAGEFTLIEPIGNHCRGTRFVNAMERVKPEMVSVFDRITENMPGFYYGRFDIRARSWDDVYAGHNLRIMEVNGVSSEPAHIYGADMNLFKAWLSILKNSHRMGQIASANHKLGVRYESISSVWNQLKAHRRYLKSAHGR